jgi:excinuclease ABC subunit A
LATQIGSQLVGVLYILDEPSIGLHQRDNERLINSLENLRDIGNSVLVVEHDKDMIERADWLLILVRKLDDLVEKSSVKEHQNNC